MKRIKHIFLYVFLPLLTSNEIRDGISKDGIFNVLLPRAIRQGRGKWEKFQNTR